MAALEPAVPGAGVPDASGTFEGVYFELKRLARFHMRSERACNAMQPTALVHETFLKLAKSQSGVCRKSAEGVPLDHGHLISLASRAMRRILVDRARARMARKRTPSGPFHGFADTAKFLELHSALDRLAQIDSRQAQIIEMRFFGGFTEDEIAPVLGVCARTVKREWKIARTWLYRELQR